jgi:hypothetical protein
VQITSDIELSGAGCTTAITPNQLVQSSSENDKTFPCGNCPTNHRFLNSRQGYDETPTIPTLKHQLFLR